MTVVETDSAGTGMRSLWGDALPEEWHVMPLKRLTTHVSRGNTPDYVDDGPTRVLNQACVQWSGLKPDACKYHADANVVGSKGELRPNDIVINSTGTGTLGRVQLFVLQGTWMADGHVTIARCDSSKLEPRFLRYVLSARPVQDYIYAALVVGATNQIELNVARLRAMLVPVPPLPEQRAIAAFLDRETARIDELVAKRGEMIAMLGARRSALLEQTIRGEAKSGVPAVETGNRWIPQLPSGWLLIRARHVIDYISSGSRGWGDYYADEGAVFIRSADLQRNSVEIHLSDAAHVILPREAEGVRTRVRQHDVLVGITGANVGYVGYIRDPVGEAYVSQHVALVRPRPDVYGEWLVYALSAPSVAAQLVAEQYGGTKQQLSLENISNLWLALPPQLNQASIARRIGEGIGRTASIVASHERSMKRLLERRQALITAAITGQIDIPPTHVADGASAAVLVQ